MKHEPNLAYIKELSGNDITFEKKFIGILKEEFPDEQNMYRDTIAKKNYEEAAQIVHKLKHKFNILGLHDAYRLAVTYEEELLNHKCNRDSEFLNVLKIVNSYLKTI